MIALPLRTKKELAIDFAHAQYICIYNEVTSQSEIIEISGNEKHNVPPNLFEVMINQGVTTVISQYYSYMALRVFKECEMDTLKANGSVLHVNLEFYKQQQLNHFEAYESIRSSDCGKQCHSCSTSTCS